MYIYSTAETDFKSILSLTLSGLFFTKHQVNKKLNQHEPQNQGFLHVNVGVHCVGQIFVVDSAAL